MGVDVQGYVFGIRCKAKRAPEPEFDVALLRARWRAVKRRVRCFTRSNARRPGQVTLAELDRDLLVNEIERLHTALRRIDREVAEWPMDEPAPYLFLLEIQQLACVARDGEPVEPWPPNSDQAATTREMTTRASEMVIAGDHKHRVRKTSEGRSSGARRSGARRTSTLRRTSSSTDDEEAAPASG
jgi:hypothetical protein